jgi:hypothetical protein
MDEESGRPIAGVSRIRRPERKNKRKKEKKIWSNIFSSLVLSNSHQPETELPAMRIISHP